MADYVYNGKGRFGSYNYSDGLNRQVGYDAKAGQVYRDHVCRPGIVDADGRTRPAVVVLPAEHKIDNFITKTETVVEHVYAPGSYSKVPPPNQGDGILNYTRCDDGKCKAGPFSSDQISKVSEFISSVQTEASLPIRKGFPAGMFQRRAGATGGWNGAIGRDELVSDTISYVARAGPAVAFGNTVTRPTNDIGAIADYVKETAMAPVFPMKEMMATETKDSREPQMRYGKFAAPGANKDPSFPTIDSRVAARRYGGTFIK